MHPKEKKNIARNEKKGKYVCDICHTYIRPRKGERAVPHRKLRAGTTKAHSTCLQHDMEAKAIMMVS